MRRSCRLAPIANHQPPTNGQPHQPANRQPHPLSPTRSPAHPGARVRGGLEAGVEPRGHPGAEHTGDAAQRRCAALQRHSWRRDRARARVRARPGQALHLEGRGPPPPAWPQEVGARHGLRLAHGTHCLIIQVGFLLPVTWEEGRSGRAQGHPDMSLLLNVILPPPLCCCRTCTCARSPPTWGMGYGEGLDLPWPSLDRRLLDRFFPLDARGSPPFERPGHPHAARFGVMSPRGHFGGRVGSTDRATKLPLIAPMLPHLGTA